MYIVITIITKVHVTYVILIACKILKRMKNIFIEAFNHIFHITESYVDELLSINNRSLSVQQNVTSIHCNKFNEQ